MSQVEIATPRSRSASPTPGGALRIVTYHRIGEVPSKPRLNPRLISATPRAFDEHMGYLARRCRVVSLAQVVDTFTGGNELPKGAVLITFDDGYRDFHDVAWPILRKHRLPATLFVPTAFPDQPEREFWWDRLFRGFHYTCRPDVETPGGRLLLGSHEERAANLARTQQLIKTMPHDDAMRLVDELCDALGVPEASSPSVLGWDQLRTLSRDGVTIGAHTRWHPLLTRVPADRVLEEAIGSQEDVRREIGEALPVFSYPNGSHDETTVRVLREAGFDLALSQLSGHNRLGATDPFRLRRVNVTRRNSLRVLRLRLQPWFAPIDRWRQGKNGRGQ